MTLRSIVSSFLRRRGYLLGKYPAVDTEAIPVFHLAVQQLMHVRGKSLSVIQVGANDGRGFGDPLTRYLDTYPWTGVLVEPQADVCDVLRRNYAGAPSRLCFENVAISPVQHQIVMYRKKGDSSVGADGATYASSVASTNRDVVARQLRIAQHDIEKIEVPCTTLDALMQKHELHDLDILQIDTEGYERDVLETLDLVRHAPRLIQFEHGHMRPGDITHVFGRLSKHGYRMLYGGRQIDSLACHVSALRELGIE